MTHDDDDERQGGRMGVAIAIAVVGAGLIGLLLGVLATGFWITPANEIGTGVMFALVLIPFRRARGCTYPKLLLASAVGPFFIYPVQIGVTAAIESKFEFTETDLLFTLVEVVITVVAVRFTLRHSHDDARDQV